MFVNLFDGARRLQELHGNRLGRLEGIGISLREGQGELRDRDDSCDSGWRGPSA